MVHFEDNEDHLSALRFEGDPEAGARDAAERAELLSGALGATIIEPKLTRKKLITGLSMLENKRDTNPARKHGNIPL